MLTIGFEHVPVARGTRQHGPHSQARKPHLPVAPGSWKAAGEQINNGFDICLRDFADFEPIWPRGWICVSYRFRYDHLTTRRSTCHIAAEGGA